MLQSTAKSSAMVPRMIWDHVVFGPKKTKTRVFWPKPFGRPFQIAQNWVLGTQKHSKTLKNTQNMPETTLVTPKGTQGSLQNSKFRKKHKNPFVTVQKRLKRLFLAVRK